MADCKNCPVLRKGFHNKWDLVADMPCAKECKASWDRLLDPIEEGLVEAMATIMPD